MEQTTQSLGLLDLITSPGFFVKDHIIEKVNAAAQALLITPGTDVRTLLQTGQEEYAEFTDGCLYLTLNMGEATVTAADGGHIFLLEQTASDSALQALALAARELRTPLSNALLSFRQLPTQEGPAQEQMARLNRGLYQLQRMLGNMSDAGLIPSQQRQELRGVCQILEEIFDKAQTLIAPTGISLEFEGPNQEVYSLVDQDLLERSVLNLLSNALKFLPKGGRIQASLTRRGRLLRLRIQDNGPGISDSIRGSLFHRYLRQPGMEDSRFGLGLGLVLVRTAAAAHGGTVLIDQPRDTGTRVTMTLRIRDNWDGCLHSPIMHIDYAGGNDHALIELSDVLPASAYEKD